MKFDDPCRRVRPLLPLLAGGELGIDDQRRVERHLIGCLACRARRDSSRGALAALRSVAVASPSDPDAPSLWPALERQIRRSRHVPARRPWLDRLGLRSVLAPWPALGLGFLGLAAVAVALIAIGTTPASSPEVAFPSKVAAAPRWHGALPATPERPPARVVAKGGVNPFDPPASIRFEYVLDRVAPLGAGGNSRDPQRSY